MVQRKQIRLGTMRLQVQSLASLSGLRIRCCRELWCRLQIQLRSGVAVAMVWAGGYSSDWTPSLGTSMCCGCSPKTSKQTKILALDPASPPLHPQFHDLVKVLKPPEPHGFCLQTGDVA